MDLYSIKTIKELLKTYKTTPKDRLGQNFLLEKRVASKILRAAGFSSKDTVLEIGPGIGTLTQELAKSAKQVVAVEKDPAMVEILKETTKDLKNIQIVQGDVLVLDALKEFFSRVKEYKVVANLPYYITSPVIRMFLETDKKPELMVLMVQKEVAQRMCAKPPDMNLLAVSVQFYAEPKIVSFVRKNAFWPQPKIDSAVVKLAVNKERSQTSPAQFFRVVKAGFKQPRKQLGNNLAQGLKLSRKEVEIRLGHTNIQPTKRAETLSLEDWVALTKSFPKT